MKLRIVSIHDYMNGAKIVISELVISFCKTVLEKSFHVVMSKSTNKHNRLYFEARLLKLGLLEAINADHVTPRDDPKSRARILSKELCWDKETAKKLWCFGSDTMGANLLVNVAKGV